MQCLELLQQLVAIPSMNPMGRAVSGDEWFETRLSDFLEAYFADHGVECERHEVAAGRTNVLACVRGCDQLPVILWDAHQDTVPADNMTIEPFRACLKDGRVYGRGACDVKGSLAAMLTALIEFSREAVTFRPTVIMACTCDEEFHEQGVLNVTRHWTDEAPSTSRILQRKPTFAVVAEPTELHVAVAHRGATRWKIRTHGKAAHSSDPTQGVNAIYRMARIVGLLQQYATGLSTSVVPHPLCGGPTLSVGRIEGGTSVNIVPDQCMIEIDRRIRPGEDGLAVIEQVEEYLRERVDFDFEMLPPWTVGVSLSDADNQDVADRLLAATANCVPGRRRIGVPFGTHAARYAAVGIPSVVCGPGSIAQAHTADEWISAEQVGQAKDVYRHFLSSWSS